MEKIKKIIVGVSTYGLLPRAEGFIKNFWSNTESPKDIEIVPVCVDDGTPNVKVVREREKFCKDWNFNFIGHEKNLGIPAAWNSLASFDKEADLVVIANDDCRLLSPGWLSRFIHFFEKNENIGTVGLPLVSEMGFKDDDERWLGKPGRVGAAVGCFFAIRPQDAFSVENPDDSRGWWISLRSFHEEIHMGFKLAEQGKISLMLPWMPVYHQGGQTFASSPELVWMDPTPYVTMDEFLFWVRQSRWYVESFEEEYAKGHVDRMSMSRIMFSKHWGILDEVTAGRRVQRVGNEDDVDIFDSPQKLVHERVVTPIPPREVVYLDKEGKEQKATV